jgi:hypothetical protein
LSGTYSFSIFGFIPASSTLLSGQGTAQLDGNGNVTAMSFTDYYTSGSPCQFTGKGTYSVTSSASGTTSVTVTSANCPGSAPTAPLTFVLQAAQQGASFLLTENDGGELATVTALKQ